MRNLDSKTAATDEELRKRITCVLESGDRRGGEIADMISHLQELGAVAIFGGMLRDLARGGPEAFQSDVDLVVQTRPATLDRVMSTLSAKQNKFGGYRICTNNWSFDVWPLYSTWAAQKELVSVKQFGDLTRTTFFDCDAIAYDCATHHVHRSKFYYESLRRRLVDIVLEDNPNPEGIVSRCRRLKDEWGFTLSPRIRSYVRKHNRHNSA